MLSEDGILTILDDGARAFVFPMLDNGYVYLAATRMSLFRSNTDWALVFEIFGYSPRCGTPDLSVTTFGSAVPCRRSASDFVNGEAFEAFLANNRYWQQEFFNPIESEDWIDVDDAEFVDPAAEELILRGRPVPLPTDADYSLMGFEVSRPIPIAQMCRALAVVHRDEALASDSERRICVSADMRPLLTLDDWSHPDVADPDCLPSRSETFRQLAAVLATEDISYFDIKPGNTHWSNWLEGGSL